MKTWEKFIQTYLTKIYTVLANFYQTRYFYKYFPNKNFMALFEYRYLCPSALKIFVIDFIDNIFKALGHRYRYVKHLIGYFTLKKTGKN